MREIRPDKRSEALGGGEGGAGGKQILKRRYGMNVLFQRIVFYILLFRGIPGFSVEG